jgi:hypothetical protein
MVVGEFTASSIAMDQDKKDAELENKIKGKADHSKLEADIEQIKASASGVRPGQGCIDYHCTLPLHAFISKCHFSSTFAATQRMLK